MKSENARTELFLDFIVAQAGKSESSKKQARIVSRGFLKSVKLLDPEKWTKNDVFNYLLKLEDYSRNTQYVYQVQLRAFLRFHDRDDLAQLIKSPRRPESLKIVPSDDEVNTMIAATDNLRDKIIIMMISRTGLRVGELCHIETNDIDLEKRQIHIRAKDNWSPKELRERIVRFDSETLELIKFYIGRYDRKRLINISESQIRRIVKGIAKKAEVKDAEKVTPHSLRHAFAVRFLTHGGDVRSLQKILGHTDLATTAIYLDLSEDAVVKAYDRVFSLSSSPKDMVREEAKNGI